jgi:Ser/Thr protein kinase RdoA (MazF antagonist)
LTNPTTTPAFTVADSERLAWELFSVKARGNPLPSERDQNFALATSDGQKFVLKIAKSDEDRAVLELQNAVLKHLATHAPGLATPRLVPSRSGQDIATVTDAHARTYFVRLITWLEGALWVDVAPHSPALLVSLGATVAELDRALQGFAHPAMHRELYWDLKRANLALEHLALLPPLQQTLVRRFIAPWWEIQWGVLRHGLIHGDANDRNILVRDNQVTGLIDFGDIVYTAVVCDPAIAMAYAMLDCPDPLAAGAAVLRGYHARFPLRVEEIQVIYALVTARLCTSLCYAAYNARAKAGDDYQQVTAGPAGRLFQQLAGLPPETPLRVFREVCRSAAP